MYRFTLVHFVTTKVTTKIGHKQLIFITSLYRLQTQYYLPLLWLDPLDIVRSPSSRIEFLQLR